MTRRPPAWTVDTAAPAVPDVDDEDAAIEAEVDAHARASGRVLSYVEPFPLRERVLRTPLALRTHRARRLIKQVLAHWAERASQGTAPPRAPVLPGPTPKRRRGHPGHPVRNDHLLALYEAQPAHLPKMTRCAHVATLFAQEIAAGLWRGRAIRPTTVRDAVEKARDRRDATRSSGAIDAKR